MKNKMQWLLMLATVIYLVPFIVFGSEVANRFVDFSLEDPQAKKYSQSAMEGKITLVVLQSRTTLQTAVDCKTELKNLIQENQQVQMISIMDLRKRPPLVPKSVLKKKISSQDPTSKEFPFLLDWDGEVTKALGGEDSKCMVLIVDPALKAVYKQEYKQAGIDSEIKPLIDKLSGGQK
ncbi:MAG TPA: TlpA family protein disulfide reductase [Candidatus Wujingus californicus]|uniref:TlpA family protein disulfide reductase n=1 Tax=Candidatus Wujingus californicus TaxID=3367618 RepID=UPI00402A5133